MYLFEEEIEYELDFKQTDNKLAYFLNSKFQFGNFKLGKFCPRLLKKDAVVGFDISFALQ